MSDATPAASLSGALGDVIKKILGPTAEYLGDELKAYAQKRRENAGKIVLNAEKKLGNKINSPGQVPPKVFKTIRTYASFI